MNESPKDNKKGIDSGEKDLAGYFLARVYNNEAIDDPLVTDSLRNANKCVNFTRFLLHLGPSNVRSIDKIKFKKSGLYLDFAQKKLLTEKASWDPPAVIARAAFVGAGNCDEMSAVTTQYYIKYLKEGERVANVVIDHKHAWSEVRTSDGVEIKFDAWAYGPPILSGDGTFSCHNHWNGEELYYYDKTRGKYLEEQIKTLLEELIEQKDEDMERLWKDFVSQQDLTSDIFKMYAASSVINNRLQCDIASKRLRRGLLLHKELVSNLRVTEEMLQMIEILQTFDKHKQILNDEIMAVGVARSLGANVRDAVADIEKIIDAYETRFKNGYRGRWVSE